MSRLTGLQEEVLLRFFRKTRSFFLTGGAALAAYHLGHRTTDDLDLFTSPAEILANKLCTLLPRGEVRDLVDVLYLERAGLRVEDALVPASTKDGGLTPAQLAWVLSQITIGPDARIPAGVTPDELRRFLEDLVTRLTRLAWPATLSL